MIWQEAVDELKAMAGDGKHCSLDAETNIYRDGSMRVKVRIYIEDIGFTDYHRTYELAFAEMRLLISNGIPMGAEQIPELPSEENINE